MVTYVATDVQRNVWSSCTSQYDCRCA